MGVENNQDPGHELPRFEVVGSVQRIMQTSGLILRDRSDIEQYVEAPLRSACQNLLEKNIHTTASSANIEEGRTEAYISVDETSLSPENRMIADRLGGQTSSTGHGGKVIYFGMKIDEHTPVADIGRHFDVIADHFQVQFPAWVARRTKDEALATAGIILTDRDADLKREILQGFVLGRDGFYYKDARDEERVHQALTSGIKM